MKLIRRFTAVVGVYFLLASAGCDGGIEKNRFETNLSQIHDSKNKEGIHNQENEELDDREDLDKLDKQLRRIGEPSLRRLRLPSNDFEVRIWDGFGVRNTNGVFIKKNKDGWSGKMVKIESFSEKGNVEKHHLTKPKSGWEGLWQKLQNHNILALRDDSEVGAVEPFEDSELVLVEILIGDKHRSYSYNAPCLSEATDGKELVEIMKVLSEEVNESFYRCRTE